MTDPIVITSMSELPSGKFVTRPCADETSARVYMDYYGIRVAYLLHNRGEVTLHIPADQLKHLKSWWD